MTGIATDTARRSSREAWLVVAVILVVFASALFLVTQHLRKELRAKIVQHQQDGFALGAALMVSPSPTEDLPDELANDPEFLFAKTADTVLEAVRRKESILSVGVFNQAGELALSVGGRSGDLTPEQLAQLQKGRPINRFEPRAIWPGLIEQSSHTSVPLIHTIVPLEQAGRFIGAAEFVTSGQEVMMTLQKLDRDLWIYSGLILFMVGCSTAGAISWAFRRLECADKPVPAEPWESNSLLEQHNVTVRQSTP